MVDRHITGEEELDALAREHIGRNLSRAELKALQMAGAALIDVQGEVLRALNSVVRDESMDHGPEGEEGGSCIGLCGYCTERDCGDNRIPCRQVNSKILPDGVVCRDCKEVVSRRYAWAHAGRCGKCHEADRKRRRSS